MQLNRFSMPKIFYIILSIELCDRIAFYGLQAIAVIYFIHNLKMSEAEASSLFASFSALAYALLVIGGIVGDKILGLKRTYLLGIIFLLVGYTTLSLSSNNIMLYLGMSIIAIGNVFSKPNTNNYVGKCFSAHDERIDAAFTYFYMVINIGIVIASLTVPILNKVFGYHIAIGFCALLMGIALILYIIFNKEFSKSDNIISPKYRKEFTYPIVISLSILAMFLLSYLLHDPYLSSIALYTGGLATVLIYLVIASKHNRLEAKGMYIALFLWLYSIVFFALYIQIATSITLFALHNVDLTFFGFNIPPGITQGFAPFFIIIISPLLSGLYIHLYKKGVNYNIYAKFATGMLLVGICFLILGIGGNIFADQKAQISILWLVIAYAIYAAGELLVSALGASMITQLLPSRIGGFGQGMWYLGAALGMKIGGELFASVLQPNSTNIDKPLALKIYVGLFYKIGGFTLLIALVSFVFVRPLSKSIGEVMKHKNAL